MTQRNTHELYSGSTVATRSSDENYCYPSRNRDAKEDTICADTRAEFLLATLAFCYDQENDLESTDLAVYLCQTGHVFEYNYIS